MTGINEGLHPVEVQWKCGNGELQPMGKAHVGEVPGGLTAMGGIPHWPTGGV